MDLAELFLVSPAREKGLEHSRQLLPQISMLHDQVIPMALHVRCLLQVNLYPVGQVSKDGGVSVQLMHCPHVSLSGRMGQDPDTHSFPRDFRSCQGL